jgi:hypothetical protein
VRVEPLAWHAPAIVDRAGDALQLGAVGEDYAALASGHQLAGLEAEGADIADGADLAPAPLRAVGVGAVLHQVEAVLAGDLHQAVQVCRVTAHVHADNRFGGGGDGSFRPGRDRCSRCRG